MEADAFQKGKKADAFQKGKRTQVKGKGKGEGYGAQSSSSGTELPSSSKYIPRWLDAQPALRHILVDAVKWSQQRNCTINTCDARWLKLVSGLQDARDQKAQKFESQFLEELQQVGDTHSSKVENSEEVEGMPFNIKIRISGADWPEEVNFILQDIHYKTADGRLATARDLCTWIAQRAEDCETRDMHKPFKLDPRQLRLIVHGVPRNHEVERGRPLCHSSELRTSGIAEASEVEVRRKRRGGARKSSGCGWRKRLRHTAQFHIHRNHSRALCQLLPLLHNVDCLYLCNPPQNDMDLQWLVNGCTCKVVVATPDPTAWSVELRCQALGTRLVIVDGVTVDAEAFMHILRKVVHHEAVIYHFCNAHSRFWHAHSSVDHSPIELMMKLRRWGCLLAPIPRQQLMALCYISKEILLPMLEFNPGLLGGATGEMRSDADIVLTAVKAAPTSLRMAADVLATDRKFVLQAVACRGRSLEYAREGMRADIEIVLTAVAENGFALVSAAECFRTDRGIVHAAISNRGVCLRFASQELKADSELVLEAVTQRGKALKHASGSLKADVQVALAALANGASLSHVAEELQLEFQQKFSFAVNSFGIDLTLQDFAAARSKAKVVQLVAAQEENELLVTCLNMQGEELASVKLAPSDQTDGIRVLCSSLAAALSTHLASLDLVLPSGVPLCAAERGQTLYEILGVAPILAEEKCQEEITG